LYTNMLYQASLGDSLGFLTYQKRLPAAQVEEPMMAMVIML